MSWKILILAAAVSALSACDGRNEQLAQVSMTPMKPYETPAAIKTIEQGIPTPAAPVP